MIHSNRTLRIEYTDLIVLSLFLLDFTFITIAFRKTNLPLIKYGNSMSCYWSLYFPQVNPRYKRGNDTYISKETKTMLPLFHGKYNHQTFQDSWCLSSIMRSLNIRLFCYINEHAFWLNWITAKLGYTPPSTVIELRKCLKFLNVENETPELVPILGQSAPLFFRPKLCPKSGEIAGDYCNSLLYKNHNNFKPSDPTTISLSFKDGVDSGGRPHSWFVPLFCSLDLSSNGSIF